MKLNEKKNQMKNISQNKDKSEFSEQLLIYVVQEENV